MLQLNYLVSLLVEINLVASAKVLQKLNSLNLPSHSSPPIPVTTSELWLNKAKFVSSFEHGDFVYFVMREHVDDRYKATIARVCKSDPGASHDQVSAKITLVLTQERFYFSCGYQLSFDFSNLAKT